MALRILVVEDNRSSMILVADVLQSADMHVSLAGSAEEALAFLEKESVDLILTDIMLPGIDGFALARKLKANPATARIPIVAMTASRSCDQRIAAEAGCEKMLPKPLDVRALPQQLADIVRCAVDLQNTIEQKLPVATKRVRGATPLQVLIVEDDPSSLKLTSAVLTMSGYVVSVASSVEHAIQSVRVRRPDAIVLDLHLPTLDGLDLIRMLRADPSTTEIPIMAVTAFNNEYSRARAFAAGCDAYITKPIDTRALPEQVGKLVASKAKST